MHISFACTTQMCFLIASKYYSLGTSKTRYYRWQTLAVLAPKIWGTVLSSHGVHSDRLSDDGHALVKVIIAVCIMPNTLTARLPPLRSLYSV